jgi:transcription-repair coupling factor (superfamily II helicase)
LVLEEVDSGCNFYEIQRNGQVFFYQYRIENIKEVRNDSVWYPMPELDWSWADGRKKLEELMLSYERENLMFCGYYHYRK